MIHSKSIVHASASLLLVAVGLGAGGVCISVASAQGHAGQCGPGCLQADKDKGSGATDEWIREGRVGDNVEAIESIGYGEAVRDEQADECANGTADCYLPEALKKEHFVESFRVGVDMYEEMNENGYVDEGNPAQYEGYREALGDMY